MKKLIVLFFTHSLVAFGGFALGIYLLPIITAPDAPSSTDMSVAVGTAKYQGEFRRDLADSDFLHWGEGELMVGQTAISLLGKVAPGPDYKLYLSPEYLETEAKFHELKSDMVRVGDVKTFENFIVPVPDNINVSDYQAVIIWCETFQQFITAAKYR